LKKQIQAPQKQSAQPTPPIADQTGSPPSLDQSRVVSNTSLQDKLQQAAAKGAYIDFADLLPTLCPFSTTVGP